MAKLLRLIQNKSDLTPAELLLYKGIESKNEKAVSQALAKAPTPTLN